MIHTRARSSSIGRAGSRCDTIYPSLAGDFCWSSQLHWTRRASLPSFMQMGTEPAMAEASSYISRRRAKIQTMMAQVTSHAVA